MTARILLLLAAFSLTGCGVAYTSLRQEADSSYTLTGANSGFFRMSARVLHCTPEGDHMKCQQTAEK